MTLCAIAAPSSSAWAQAAGAHDPIASLFGSPTGGEPTGASSEESEASAAPEAPLALAVRVDQRPFGSLSLARLPALATPAPEEQGSAEPPASDGADDGAGLRTAGYVAGGVGLAGMALFAIAGLGAKSAYDQLNTDCGDAPCTDEAHRSDIEGGRMLQTAANIGLAAGLTGLGVGATLIVLGSHSSVEKRGPSAFVSPSGAMFTYGGHF